jgi:outer membrane lipoprotein carrier protein
MMKKIFLLFMLIMAIAVPALAAGDPAVEAIEALRRGLAGTNDFTADITQEKHLALMKQKMVSKGIVRFKKPDMFYMELYPPHPSRLVLKNNEMTMRLQDQGATQKVMLPPDQGLRKWLTYFEKPTKTLPEGADVQAEKHGKLWTLQILPKGKGSVKRLTLTYDLQGTINRVIISERNNDRTILTFSKFRRNVGLTDADFRVE